MPDFHHDLRRSARFMPPDLGLPTTLRLQRGLDALARSRRTPGVSVIPLASGASIRVHRPAAAAPNPAPALLWIHGGGYVIGTAHQDDKLCRDFSAELGITVASVDYRLAPEHPYPAAVDDCCAAFEWLAAQPAVDPASIAVGGASAGGGLAAALAFRARDRGEIRPVLQLLSYPMLDDRTGTGATPAVPGHRWWGPRSNRFAWAAYLGTTDPHAAVPARQQELSGLPAAWIGVGSLDLFRDEDVRHAERLNAAGVPCELEVIQGAYHGFDAIAPRAAVSRLFFQRRCDVLTSAFSG